MTVHVILAHRSLLMTLRFNISPQLSDGVLYIQAMGQMRPKLIIFGKQMPQVIMGLVEPFPR